MKEFHENIERGFDDLYYKLYDDYLYESINRETRNALKSNFIAYSHSIELEYTNIEFNIICDETNNPAEVIDNGSLVLSVSYRYKTNDIFYKKYIFGNKLT